MDPLSKIDSAISVASKDNGILEGDPIDDDYPPPPASYSASHAHGGSAPSSSTSHPITSQEGDRIATSTGTDPRKDDAPAAVSQAQPQPEPAPAPAPASASATAPASAKAQSPALAPAKALAIDNLIQPPEVAQGSPQPPHDARSASPDPWYDQSEVRPATPSGHSSHAVVDPPSLAGSTGNDHDFDHDEDYPPSPAGGEPAAATYEDHAADELDALTQSGTGAIDVDHDQLELESDPGYESDGASLASTSLSSSVRDYLYENGRRYHRFREGRYNFPNDEPEQDREDMKHACVKMLCQERLHFAPLAEDVHTILDIGTGTGIWAIEIGDQFPSADVLGIDLSPIQPEWVPSNVHFMVDDAESEWVHPRDHFDYIHTRHTVMAIKDWPRLYRTALEHLKPGGWIESQEIYHYPISANESMPQTHPVAQYWALINEGLQRLGIDFHAAAGGKIADMMRDAGLVNVQERVLHVPLGTWPRHPDLKRVGEYWRHILLEGAQAIALGPLTRGCGWTREQVEVFLVEVRRAYMDNNSLMYMPMYVTYGQKPEH